MIIVLLLICLILICRIFQYSRWLDSAHDHYTRKIKELEFELSVNNAELKRFKQMYKESERIRKILYHQIKENNNDIGTSN